MPDITSDTIATASASIAGMKTQTRYTEYGQRSRSGERSRSGRDTRKHGTAPYDYRFLTENPAWLTRAPEPDTTYAQREGMYFQVQRAQFFGWFIDLINEHGQYLGQTQFVATWYAVSRTMNDWQNRTMDEFDGCTEEDVFGEEDSGEPTLVARKRMRSTKYSENRKAVQRGERPTMHRDAA